MDKYDGTKDPTAHMESFCYHLILHGTPDEIACRAFPPTLDGVAKDWFGELEPKSIDDFKTLRHLFLTQFLAVRKDKKNPACLLSIQQGKNESLKDYMQRFNREKLYVEKVSDDTILSALMNGIRTEDLLFAELAKRKRQVSLPQFMQKAEQFII
jgi:hypothetical protein